MLRLVRFPSPTILRRRVALALTVIAAVACADRVTTPDPAATDRASKDIIPPTNPFDDLWVSPHRAVNAGEAAWGTIHMKQPAPAGGAHIIIRSTNPKVASLDSTLFIPEGAVSQDFLVQTYSTPINIGIQVYADWGQWRVTGGFTVFHVPAPPA